MNNSRIEEIRNNKLKRQRQRRIKLIIFFVAIAAIIFLIYFAIAGTTRLIKNSMPKPTPTPVSVISENQADGLSTSRPQSTSDGATPMPEPTFAPLPNASEANDLLSYVENSGTTQKVCYLTFDDGPNNSVTIDILDILRRYNIKATFFEVGSLIETNYDSARRVYEEGHLIGGHSMNHKYDAFYNSTEDFTNEVKTAEEQIKAVVGDDFFPLIRFPGGSYNAGSYGEIKQDCKEALKSIGYYFVDWNALSGDAEGTKKSAEQLVERIKSTTKGKNQVVILMHDATTKTETVKALPDIIDYLISEGYSFSRMDKMIL